MQSDRLLLYIQQHFQRKRAVLTSYWQNYKLLLRYYYTCSYMSGEAWERMLPVIHETAYINSTVPDITMPLPSKREQPLGADLDLHWRRRVIWLRRLGSFASGHDAECAVLIGRILASRLRFTLRVAVCIVCCLFYLYNLLIWTQVHQHIYGKNGDLYHYVLIIMCWHKADNIYLIKWHRKETPKFVRDVGAALKK